MCVHIQKRGKRVRKLHTIFFLHAKLFSQDFSTIENSTDVLQVQTFIFPLSVAEGKNSYEFMKYIEKNSVSQFDEA